MTQIKISVVSKILGPQTKRMLKHVIRQMDSSSVKPSRLLAMGITDCAPVISKSSMRELIELLPKVLAYQIVSRKLSTCSVYGLERERFEELKKYAGRVKEKLALFNLDYTHDDLFFKLIKHKSTTLKKSSLKFEYVLVDQLISNLFLRRLISYITFDLWGYNGFTGLYLDMEILKRMNLMDTAYSLQSEKSITPLRVFADFVDIHDSIDRLVDISKQNRIDKSVVYFRSNNLRMDKRELRLKLSQYVEKYPFLSQKKLEEYPLLVLARYTREPSFIIDELGPDTMCFPYTIPTTLNLEGPFAQSLPEIETGSLNRTNFNFKY